MRLIVLILLAACALNEPPPIDTRAQPLVGAVGGDENPLTFWWFSGDGAQLRPALECALERIRAATCLPVDVSLDAHHWVRFKTAEQMGGRVGWTTGAWDSARISLKTPMGPMSNCRVLIHEIAQHVLRRSNSHVGASLMLDSALLEAVCSVQDCRCFNPETNENPVPSTQAACLDPFSQETP